MSSNHHNPTERFSSRVQNYIKYRPGYPVGVMDLLGTQCGLSPGAVVADVGSGTGILTAMLLGDGNRVYGVEPNLPMRSAAQELLSAYPGFISVDGTAEQTGLEPHSVDLITAGQAFHWFRPEQAGAEFRRILRPGRYCALLWNARLTDTTPFLRDYEALLQQFGTDYNSINHRNIDDDTNQAFYTPGVMHKAQFPNHQSVDYDGLEGRLLSSSYVPESGQPGYHEMLDALRIIYERHQQSGQVVIEYRTDLYYGRLEG